MSCIGVLSCDAVTLFLFVHVYFMMGSLLCVNAHTHTPVITFVCISALSSIVVLIIPLCDLVYMVPFIYFYVVLHGIHFRSSACCMLQFEFCKVYFSHPLLALLVRSFVTFL